jgi:hypothetical protein
MHASQPGHHFDSSHGNDAKGGRASASRTAWHVRDSCNSTRRLIFSELSLEEQKQLLERLEKSLQATIIVALKLKEERYDPYFLELHGEVNARLKVSVSSQRVAFLVQSFDCQPKPRTDTRCAP